MKSITLLFLSYLLILGSKITALSPGQYCDPHAISNLKMDFLKVYKEEGFTSGTLIAIPEGYKEIQYLNEKDVLFVSNIEGKLLHIHKVKVNCFIRIYTKNFIINAASYQKFLVCNDGGKWVRAFEIQRGDLLLKKDNTTCIVESTELTLANEEVYQLTTKNHYFCITQENFIVHNADPITITSSVIAIGSIFLLNPIQSILGFTTAILIYANQHNNQKYGSLINEISNKLGYNKPKNKDANYDAYLKKLELQKQRLLQLKNDFLIIIRSLKDLATSNTYCSFTSCFLDRYLLNSPLLLDLYLPAFSNINTLKHFYKHQFVQIEKEILEVQITIAFHFNELIQRLDNALAEIENNSSESDKVIDRWNRNLCSMSYAIAHTMYKNAFQDEDRLDNLECKKNELTLAIHYYKTASIAIAIKNSSNSLEVISHAETNIHDIDKYISDNKKRINHNKVIAEEYFLSQKISITHLKDQIKEKIKNYRSHRNSKDFDKSLNNRSAFYFPEPPNPKKNNDDNNKPQHPNGIYKDAPYHHPNSRGLKSCAPKDGQAALDNSVQIKATTPRRIGTSKSQIVILDQTGEGLFHGHVRTWEELGELPYGEKIKSILIENGLTDKLGNIL